MGKSEDTKDTILKISAGLFNTQGYKATSISDITFASGFTKGALYTHFENKEALEKEALKYMCREALLVLGHRIKCENNALDKMRSVFQYYISHVMNPIMQGGCPVLNAAIEVDDTNPDMKNILKYVIQSFHESLVHILNNGIRYGQLKAELDVKGFSTFIIASLEGAIMMSKVAGNNEYLKQVCTQLEKQLDLYALD